MIETVYDTFRPVNPPRVIEDAYTPDQHQRIIGVVRDNAPWPLIVAQNFKSPEEIIAVTGGKIPEGEAVTWDKVLSPKFRGWIARQGICYYPELYDCYFNPKFLDLARHHWGAKYAEPESFLFNLQGASSPGSVHLDAVMFRGMNLNNTPIWLLLIMAKSGLFQRWQSKKVQITSWYYKGTGGGFKYWPDGPRKEAKQISSPMWGRAIVAENEMMFHHALASGPEALRYPAGLDINSTIGPDPTTTDGWQIETSGHVIQRIRSTDLRLLLHWGARVYMDMAELKTALDHTDDMDSDKALNLLMADLRARNIAFEMPTDPINDRAFIALLSQVYDVGQPDGDPFDQQ